MATLKKEKVPVKGKSAGSAPSLDEIKLDVQRAMADIEIMDILSPKRELDLKIQKIFEEHKGPFSVILSISREQYEQAYLRLVSKMLDDGFCGVFVTVNKSIHDLLSEFKTDDMKINNLVFIDAVTKMIDGKKVVGKQFIYLDSPNDLTGLSVSLETSVKKFGKKKTFVVFDSLTTLLIYNNEVTVEKFIHSVAQKLKEGDARSIFLAAKASNEGVITTLTQFFDGVFSI